MFTLEMPMMQYKITLDVLELQGITVNNSTGNRHVDWRLISTFHLSPSRTIGRSKSGQVQQKLLSNLHTHTYCMYTNVLFSAGDCRVAGEFARVKVNQGPLEQKSAHPICQNVAQGQALPTSILCKQPPHTHLVYNTRVLWYTDSIEWTK